jgi:cellulose synthase/poly-beta-1,6-N-acetylglucosamine synthase-like glycosyltransferase
MAITVPGSAAAIAAFQTKEASEIPVQEVIVVFDADMVCKRAFLRHVSSCKADR